MQASSARSCSFCGLAQKDARKMVAGQGVYICDRCIALATVVAQEDVARANDRVVLSPISEPTARCGFCWKLLHQARGMAGTADARICGECLALCEDVVEVITPERQRELDRKFGRRPPGL